MLAIPEYYACKEPMKFVALNNLNNEKTKVRLSGITCDCDDVFYDIDQGYIEMPAIHDEPLYIAILGTGSYQESMAPQNGIRHCMVPNEKRFVSFIKNGQRQFVLLDDTQTIDELRITTKANKKHLKQFEI